MRSYRAYFCGGHLRGHSKQMFLHAASRRNPLRDDGATLYHRWTLALAAARSSYRADCRGGHLRDHSKRMSASRYFPVSRGDHRHWASSYRKGIVLSLTRGGELLEPPSSFGREFRIRRRYLPQIALIV